MTLENFFRFCDESFIGEMIRDSTWAFAAIEVVHLLGLTVLLGTVTVVSLRMLGAGLKSQSTQEIAKLTLPWTYAGMAVTIVSGVLLFLSEAMKCYGSPPFFVKMGSLAVAMVVTYVSHSRMAKTGISFSPAVSGIFGLLLLVTWFGVGLAGRAIAFF